MRLISLNIEGYSHSESVFSYFKESSPDVICLQEIHQDTLTSLAKELAMESCFAPMVSLSASGKAPWGIAILSKYPILRSKVVTYDAFTEDYPEFKGRRPERPKAALLTAELQNSDNSKPIILGCTHFTWSPNSSVTEQQKVNFKNLLPLLDKYPEIILCGDFNSPRGKEIYDTLSSRYRDNIPPDVISTLDPDLHRAGQLKLVVDGLFSTPGYQVKAVKVVSHISDHCAIEADIEVAP